MVMWVATTKIWTIKDSISRVISYAKNPEKTTFSDLKQVLKYAEDDEKTMYVTGVNCNAQTAYEEMITVQNRFDKTTGNVAYHAYQSFKTGEVSPELAHKIGVKLAEKMWSEYQVEKPTGKTPRSIYFAEKRGEPTKYNVIRQAIDETMQMCINYGQFKKIMLKKGYIINDDYNRKYPTIRSINDKKAVRMYHLGEEYLPKNIANKVEHNHYYYQNRYMEFIHPKKKKQKYKVYKYKGKFKEWN